MTRDIDKPTRPVELSVLRCPVCRETFRAERGSYTPNHPDPTGEEPCAGVGELLVRARKESTP